MPGAKDIPAWVALHACLVALQESLHARLALVFDTSSSVWGFGWYAPSERPSEEVDRQLACYETELNTKWDVRDNELKEKLPFIEALVEQALATLTPEARRPGSQFSVILVKETPFLYLQSFEGIYLLMLEFETAFEPERVSAAVEHVLPQIKALTLALPPPNGPSTTEGAACRFYLEEDPNRFDPEAQVVWRGRGATEEKTG